MSSSWRACQANLDGDVLPESRGHTSALNRRNVAADFRKQFLSGAKDIALML